MWEVQQGYFTKEKSLKQVTEPAINSAAELESKLNSLTSKFMLFPFPYPTVTYSSGWLNEHNVRSLEHILCTKLCEIINKHSWTHSSKSSVPLIERSKNIFNFYYPKSDSSF